MIHRSVAVLESRSESAAFTKQRADRLAGIRTRVLAVFRAQAKPDLWLRRPNRVWNNIAPLDVPRNRTALKSVETILGRMEYGVFS